MANLILGSTLFSNVILPFLFIFTITFAILEKTKFISEKKDIHAIIALVFGLVTIGVPWAIGVVLNIIPVVAVIIVILIAWLMTYGFMSYEQGKPMLTGAWKRFLQIVLGIVFIGVIIWSTGAYKLIANQSWASGIGETVLLVGAVIAIIAIVLSSGGPAKPEGT